MPNKMVRFILKLGPRSHIGDEQLKTVGMLKVEDRVRQLKLNHVFKIYNEVVNMYNLLNDVLFLYVLCQINWIELNWIQTFCSMIITSSYFEVRKRGTTTNFESVIE